MANGSVLAGVRPNNQPVDLAGSLLGGQQARQSVLAGQQQLQQGQMQLDRAPEVAAQQDAAAAQQQQLGQQQISENDFAMAVQRGRIINRLAKQVREMPAGQRPQFVQALDPEMLQSVGIDPAQIKEVGLDDNSLDAIIAQTDAALSSVDGGLTAGQRDRQSLLNDIQGGIDPQTGQLKPEEQLTAQQRAAAVELGLLARTGTLTGQERIATSPERTQQVAESERTITRGRRIGTGEGVSAVSGLEAEAAAEEERAVLEARGDVERAQRQPKVRASGLAARAKVDRVVDAIDRVLPRVSAITAGPGATLASLPGTTARNVRADIDTIKANLGFQELQEMRDNSPTGGALGQVSERELGFLQSVVANLEQDQSPEQLRRNLEIAKQAIQDSWRRVADAYEQQYGEPMVEVRPEPGPSPGGAARTVNWGDLP